MTTPNNTPAAPAARTPLLLLLLLLLTCDAGAAINRRTVVSRHDVLISAVSHDKLDTSNDVLTVGNGAFGFNVDVTGLQSFNASYSHLGVNTLADWGWHSTPFSKGDPTYALRHYNFTYYDTPTDGKGTTRQVPYANDGSNDGRVVSWLMGNPHRLNLGQTSLRWGVGGRQTLPLELLSISNASQRLDLWSGEIRSNFTLTSPAPVTCALVNDNTVAEFSCGDGAVIQSVAWASYGRPSGSCAIGFQMNPQCASNSSRDVLSVLCVGKPSCSLLVNYQAGFGDPCSGDAKWLAANVTCVAATAASPAPVLYGARTPRVGAPAASSIISVSTIAHPDVDLVSTAIACSAGPCTFALHLAFPYGSTAFGPTGADWEAADALHTTTVLQNTSSGLSLLRTLDSDSYRVDCSWTNGALSASRAGPHAFDLLPTPPSSSSLSLSGTRTASCGVAVPWPSSAVSFGCLYTPVGAGGALVYPVGADQPWLQKKKADTQALLDGGGGLPGHSAVAAAAASFWADFWSSGAFVDLASNTNDPQAFELERRVVLSQYLLRVNDAGAEPPQETGLLCNSWNGKHHNEMRLWHQAHWLLWGRPELTARSDGFFFDQLQNATSFATFEGYAGAHWPKETAAVANRSAMSVPWLGLDESPWPFGGAPNGTMLVWESSQVDNALIIWQQPHIIWMGELSRRAANATGGPSAALAEVQRLSPLVLASADYLAARMYFNESDGANGRYWLGPPVEGGQEGSDPYSTYNPVFEMVYIALTLDIANEWREYLGLPSSALYAAISANLASLPVDKASPPGSPLYTFDLYCVCMYLSGGVSNPQCNASWLHPGIDKGTSCPTAMSSHPLIVAPFGLLNGIYHGAKYGVNITTVNATLSTVLALWSHWTDTWGWDDALLATSMSRLGWSPEEIVTRALLDPQFEYYKNGHTRCCPTYLPGNGGLLLAVAMLSFGTDTSPPLNFPASWGAAAEGFNVPFI